MSATEKRQYYFSPDRGLSDPCIAGSETELYSTVKEEMKSRVGFSSAAAGWFDDVLAECWSLPPTDGYERHTSRHRLVVLVGPTPTYVKWDDNGDKGAALHAPGAISLIPQDSTSKTTWTADLNIVSLEFSGELMSRLLDDNGAFSEQLVPRRNVPDALANALAHQIMDEMASPTERVYGESLCVALAFHLLRTHGRARIDTARGRLSSFQARRVLDYIHSNLGGEISVSVLARETALSEAHFARAFRNTFDEPPHRLILRWRLQRAARLIRLGGLGLTEAALAAGFCDQAHMTNSARRHFGTSLRAG